MQAPLRSRRRQPARSESIKICEYDLLANFMHPAQSKARADFEQNGALIFIIKRQHKIPRLAVVVVLPRYSIILIDEVALVGYVFYR